VILAKSGRIPAKIGKLLFFFLDFCEPKLVEEYLLGQEHVVGEEGLPNSDEFVGFRLVF
jgi:hypothetical protein